MRHVTNPRLDTSHGAPAGRLLLLLLLLRMLQLLEDLLVIPLWLGGRG
jgi:hypothetical protein